ncbi:CatB-related O-acetyltransferase [Photobacterium sp. 1_MG-2023]|uniref:CatB-related O-acetyltransferase n=1 Tax=Photobacterium sp. 1_MG-2023 TaxID=3062646 RepID=UPI0026E2F3BF|nr:CatB-related O-acetyltransferase [Photobacterium sp. 1_MG-2023]MDO6708246.1 CatB-related O-acetyltransferase [Photobacterium sp. 1_MG-2023]
MSTIFPSWLGGYELNKKVSNPNIIVGDFTYYSGYYHDKDFEDCCVRYLLGDHSTKAVWESGIFGEVDKLVIGKFCSIASGAVFMLAGNQGHRHDWISSYPFDVSEFGNKVKPGFERVGDTVIGNDVWLGSECVIMPGVHIADGAVIGARAVVTKDVPPYSIVVGNPGRVVKTRFSEAQVAKLLEIKWWDWSLSTLKDNMDLMCSQDIDALYERYLKFSD